MTTTKTKPAAGDWFQTFTGREWAPLAPNPEDVELTDIARGLANQCRFNGHCVEFYSVAEHSVRVSRELRPHGPEVALCGLLHDAAEAYLGDLVRPVKRQLPAYREMEHANQIAIFIGLGVPFGPDSFDRLIRAMDQTMLATERRDIMASCAREWEGLAGVEPLEAEIHPFSPDSAMALFVLDFETLIAELGL